MTRLALGATALLMVATSSAAAAQESSSSSDDTQSAWTVWDSLAQCESNGRWQANTGNGFYGGTQTLLSTWRAYGGQEFASRPDLATREEQIIVNERILAGQGYRAWPTCSRRLGLRA